MHKLITIKDFSVKLFEERTIVSKGLRKSYYKFKIILCTTYFRVRTGLA